MLEGLAATLQGVASVIAAVSALVAAYFTFKTRSAVEQVHVATNSMKDELVRATAKQNRAEGVLQGVAQERANPTEAPVTEALPNEKIIEIAGNQHYEAGRLDGIVQGAAEERENPTVDQNAHTGPGNTP